MTHSAANMFNKYASQYQAKFMDVSLYHAELDLFCSSINQHEAEILDVACGPGNISCYLLQKRPDFKLLGIDLAPRMLELAKTNNPSASFLELDARAIDQLSQKFHGIILGFVFPYLPKREVKKVIKKASEKLENQGVLYLSTIEGNYAKSKVVSSSIDPADQSFQYYYEADYLQAALHKSGFLTLKLSRKKTINSEGVKTTELILLAQKH